MATTKVFVLLSVFVVFTLCSSELHSFNKFIQKYKKNYASETEYAKRFDIFKKNLNFINQHNKKNSSFTVAMNKFGDLSLEEWRSPSLSNFYF